MKKFCLIVISFLLLGGMFYSVSYAQQETPPAEKEDHEERNFKNNPADLLRKVYIEANDDNDKVQATSLDSVNSKYCNELYLQGNFTLARTLCSIKYSIRGYLQYAVYIGLTAAVIFIIRNGFKIVTSANKEEQMKRFGTNMKYIIIGVILLTSFYFILEAFVSVVNFIAGD